MLQTHLMKLSVKYEFVSKCFSGFSVQFVKRFKSHVKLNSVSVLFFDIKIAYFCSLISIEIKAFEAFWRFSVIKTKFNRRTSLDTAFWPCHYLGLTVKSLYIIIFVQWNTKSEIQINSMIFSDK